MRYILLICCCTLCLSASAQWYRIDKALNLKKNERYPAIEAADITCHSLAAVKIFIDKKPARLMPVQVERSEYSYNVAENVVMRLAQHNMRFRVYNDASFNFTDLAHLYMQQNRYSEAKWFLLQSNIISRQQNDDKHTIANLIDLATIKSEMGDYSSAQQDLAEALEMANWHMYKDDVARVDKKMAYIKLNKNNTPRTDFRYAEVPDIAVKAKAE